MSAELLPCPFCGKGDQLKSSDPCEILAADAGCGRCGVYVAGPTRSVAIERWNRRTAPASAAGMEPVAIAEGDKLYWIAGRAPTDDKDRYLCFATAGAAQAAMPGGWISVEDGMPAQGSLIVKRWRKNDAVWAGVYSGSAKDSSFDCWMPIPAAPASAEGVVAKSAAVLTDETIAANGNRLVEWDLMPNVGKELTVEQIIADFEKVISEEPGLYIATDEPVYQVTQSELLRFLRGYGINTQEKQ